METIKMCVMEGRDVKTPVRAHKEDAGIDIFYPNDRPAITIQPNQDVLVQTGIRVAVPKGYAMLVMNKSGIATKRHLDHGAELIDENYFGELGIHLFNFGDKPATIEPGDKFVQVILVPVGNHMVEMISEEDFMKTHSSDRGEGGFGSTGTK